MMMYRRITLAGLAGGGWAATALLQAATALADAPGANVFTIGSTTFDPYYASSSGAEVQGWAPLTGISVGSPLWELGEPAASQYLDVYNAAGVDIGTIAVNDYGATLLGNTDIGFTVAAATPAGGDTSAQAAELPAVGAAYDVFNLGHGVENVYTATPGADGTVTDTLVTPLGDINLSPLVSGIDAAKPLQPANAVTALVGHTGAGNSDAFAIGTLTFDPFTVTSSGAEVPGFATVYQLIGILLPLLNLGGGSSTDWIPPLATQSFDVYNGAASSSADIGTISTSEYVADLLGMTNTAFTVTDATAAVGDTGAQAAELPVVGTVYDVFSLGHGVANVYTATPGADGAVTDTVVTPLGDINLSSLVSGINATMLDPGAAFDVSSAAASVIDLSLPAL